MLGLIYCLITALCAPATASSIQKSPGKADGGWSVVRGIAVSDPDVTHDGKTSLRLEAAKTSPDACARSAPVSLTIGNRYELSGWVRTANLTVRDLDRCPMGTGAALTMASMPFDVHSAPRQPTIMKANLHRHAPPSAGQLQVVRPAPRDW